MMAGIGVFPFWCHSSIKPYLPFRVMCTGLTLSLAPLTNAALALLLVCGVVTTGGNVLLIILFWQTFQIMFANWGNGVVVNSCVCYFSRRAGGQHALRPTSDQEHLPKLSGGSGGLDNVQWTCFSSTCTTSPSSSLGTRRAAVLRGWGSGRELGYLEAGRSNHICRQHHGLPNCQCFFIHLIDAFDAQFFICLK